MAVENVGSLCYGYRSTALCYKIDGSTEQDHLVYKWTDRTEVAITISWGSEVRDIDICAFWVDDPSNKFGWSYHGVSPSGVFKTRWSGDDTSSDGSEWLALSTTWETKRRKFRVHVNVYGEGDGGQCTIKARGILGRTTSTTVNASTRYGQKAEDTDPGVVITIDQYGHVESIEPFR